MVEVVGVGGQFLGQFDERVGVPAVHPVGRLAEAADDEPVDQRPEQDEPDDGVDDDRERAAIRPLDVAVADLQRAPQLQLGDAGRGSRR